MDSAYTAKLNALFDPKPTHPAILVAGTNLSGTKTFLQSFGSTSFSKPSPVADDAVVWLASSTKPFTAVAALQCVDRGLFSLDSAKDVARLIPEMAEPDIFTEWNADTQAFKLGKASRTFTLRELLTHQSGLCYDVSEPRLHAWRASRGEGVKWLCGSVAEAHTLPLLAEPGTDFHYSGGYEWVGRMIERANDCSLEEYFSKHIFTPLGIRDMTFDLHQRPDMEARRVQMATRFAEGESIRDGWHPAAADAQHQFKEHFGGGGLYGTVGETLKFFTALLKNDGTLLPPSLVDELIFKPQLGVKSKETLNAFVNLAPSILVPGLARGTKCDWGVGSLLVDEEWEGHASTGSLLSSGLGNTISVSIRAAHRSSYSR